MGDIVRVLWRKTLGWSFLVLFGAVSVLGQWLHVVSPCGHAHRPAVAHAAPRGCSHHAHQGSHQEGSAPVPGDPTSAHGAAPGRPAGSGLYRPPVSVGHDAPCAICKFFSQAKAAPAQHPLLGSVAAVSAVDPAQPRLVAVAGHLPYQPRAPPAAPIG